MLLLKQKYSTYTYQIGKIVSLTINYVSLCYFFLGRCGETVSRRTGEVSDLWWLQVEAARISSHNPASVCCISHQLQCIMGSWGKICILNICILMVYLKCFQYDHLYSVFTASCRVFMMMQYLPVLFCRWCTMIHVVVEQDIGTASTDSNIWPQATILLQR